MNKGDVASLDPERFKVPVVCLSVLHAGEGESQWTARSKVDRRFQSKNELTGSNSRHETTAVGASLLVGVSQRTFAVRSIGSRD